MTTLQPLRLAIAELLALDQHMEQVRIQDITTLVLAITNLSPLRSLLVSSLRAISRLPAASLLLSRCQQVLAVSPSFLAQEGLAVSKLDAVDTQALNQADSHRQRELETSSKTFPQVQREQVVDSHQ